MRRVSLLFLCVFLFTLSLEVRGGNNTFKSGASFARYVVGKINEGDRNILRTISYKDINFVLDYARVLYEGKLDFLKKRSKVVNAALKGLFNTDPRVSLICIDILNLMKVDRLMEPEVSLVNRRERHFNVPYNISNMEYDYKDYYNYIDIFGKALKKSMAKELHKLYKFVLRDKFLFLMLKRDPHFLKNASKEEFFILYKAIGNEGEDRVPLRSYKENKLISPSNLRVVISGLANPNLVVKKSCANFLINYYNYNAPYLSRYYRNQILSALKEAYIDNVIAKPKLIKLK